MRKSVAFILTLSLVSAIAPPASAAPIRAAAPCTAPGFKTLNFFLGDWLVISNDGSGTVLGYDTVIHALGDCGFYEYWRDANNTHRAFAIFGYQPGAESWHFNWLGDDGMEAYFDGSRTRTTAMSMSGVDYMGRHRRLHHLEWIANPDGSLEKIWKSSTDEGRTWIVTFDGIYYRKNVGGRAASQHVAPIAATPVATSPSSPMLRDPGMVNTYDTPSPGMSPSAVSEPAVPHVMAPSPSPTPTSTP